MFIIKPPSRGEFMRLGGVSTMPASVDDVISNFVLERIQETYMGMTPPSSPYFDVCIYMHVCFLTLPLIIYGIKGTQAHMNAR